ncbi:MAG: phosphatase PAP2 family protein [Betaproteobacteria bacterium]|nr:phosphatase PAP2 family protein [Betaproteobacteria bacterium]
MPNKIETLCVALSFLAGALLFSLWPQIDVAISAWFYVPGEGFAWGRHWLVEGIYWFVWGGSRIVVVSVPLLLGISFWMKRGWLVQRRRWLGFLALAIALGPGLIVDQALKNHWGRARPEQNVMFGGDKQFTPALLPAQQCGRNCSFVSGHATAAFALMSFGWLAGPARRRRWMALAAVTGLAVGLVRIVQGGHYASDVFFAFYAVWLGNFLAWAILKALRKLPDKKLIPMRLR